jgi:hypothetical protein
MNDETELSNDDASHAPLYAEGDAVRHKASKQTAVILYVRDVVIHNKSCPCAQPFASLALNLPPCDCPATFTGEYAISTGFAEDEEIVIDECVLEPV